LHYACTDLGAIDLLDLEASDRLDFELSSGIDQRHDVVAAQRHHHARRAAALIDAGAAENLLKSGHVWFSCPSSVRQREILRAEMRASFCF
jgi:hypothetical protein